MPVYQIRRSGFDSQLDEGIWSFFDAYNLNFCVENGEYGHMHFRFFLLALCFVYFVICLFCMRVWKQRPPGFSVVEQVGIVRRRNSLTALGQCLLNTSACHTLTAEEN